MNKKKLFLWSLYDFANSFVFINFLLYFAQWIVIDGGLSDFWYNAIFAITSILLLFTAPTLAAFTDRHGGRKYFLNIATVGTFVFYGGAALLAYLGSGQVMFAAVLFLLGQYFYQLAFIFYNPMIDEVADEAHRARASGIAYFANGLGQVVGLLMTLPLAGSRAAPLLPAVGAFFILALPMMIFFKTARPIGWRSEGHGHSHILKKVWMLGGGGGDGRLRQSVREIADDTRAFARKFMAFFAVSAATPLLLAYFFFNDAVVTLSNNYPIYMDRVFGITDAQKSMLLIAVLTMSALGGAVSGWVADRIGQLRTLRSILVGWSVLLPAIAWAPNFAVFAVLTFLVGTLLGSLVSVSRSYLSILLRPEEMGYGFAFFTLFERFATFVGPLAWGGILLALGPASSSYRLAALAMTVFILVGLWVLRRPAPHNFQ